MKKTEYINYFKGKKITIMGLGLLGRGIGVTKFLAECGAELIVTDLKKEIDLKKSLNKLDKFSNIKYVLGEHRIEDFANRDLVIKAAGVPFDSIFIEEAKKNNIPVEMDASLFAKIAKGVYTIGVTGTRGKSTVTHLLHEIISNSSKRVFLGGNVKGLATLPLLKKVKAGDIVLMELDSWQLQGFGDNKISPNMALFTTFLPDHLNYYRGDLERYFSDKANIYRYQKEGDVFLMRPEVSKFIKEKDEKNIKVKYFVAGKKMVPANWKIKLLGEHNLENIALAFLASQKLGISEAVAKKTIEKFIGVPGRLQFIKEKRGVKFYNDTTATTPDGVIAAMDALQDYKGKIILIGGGADKNLEYKEYSKIVPKYVKNFILFTGVATEKIKKELSENKKVSFIEVSNMKDAFKNALVLAEKGDIVLLSPGAASFGIFKNEFDRGSQFDKIVSALK
ncbi:MAG: UDP-N-acetylmuramoyl-L-alanine--D-glutamate ligase [bacterium]